MLLKNLSHQNHKIIATLLATYLPNSHKVALLPDDGVIDDR